MHLSTKKFHFFVTGFLAFIMRNFQNFLFIGKCLKALLQSDFAQEQLLPLFKHSFTAFEKSGYVTEHRFLGVLAFTDVFDPSLGYD